MMLGELLELIQCANEVTKYRYFFSYNGEINAYTLSRQNGNDIDYIDIVTVADCLNIKKTRDIVIRQIAEARK